jgi:hypothetical protein
MTSVPPPGAAPNRPAKPNPGVTSFDEYWETCSFHRRQGLTPFLERHQVNVTRSEPLIIGSEMVLQIIRGPEPVQQVKVLGIDKNIPGDRLGLKLGGRGRGRLGLAPATSWRSLTCRTTAGPGAGPGGSRKGISR